MSYSSDEDRPMLGGKSSYKRKDPTPDSDLSNPPKRPKMAPTAGAAAPSSFAAKMMAKMGYKEGEGLGASGRGRLAPIETQRRPQGAGLGAVKEKTKQAKEEEKREAAFRGEVVEDSSEEEKGRRRRQKEQRASTNGITQTGTVVRPKTKYKSMADIEAAAEGLEVPNVLKSIIDLTGKETKLLTSAVGLMSPERVPPSGFVTTETQAAKIARRARIDLEAFVDEWQGLTERKKLNEFQGYELVKEVGRQIEESEKLNKIIENVERIRFELEDQGNFEGESDRWEMATTKLEAFFDQYHAEIAPEIISEVAVAAIHPLLNSTMNSWDPLQGSEWLVGYFYRLQPILGAVLEAQNNALLIQNDSSRDLPHNKSTTHFESMIYTIWFPRVRSAIVNEWDVYDPDPLIVFIEQWRPILPSFIIWNIVNQLIVQRLTTALSDWQPLSIRKKHSNPYPHIWLLPWFDYLDEHHTDHKGTSGLAVDARRKFGKILKTWNVANPNVPGLDHENWRKIVRKELDTVLVCRLASHLRENFEVDPQDQDLTALTEVLAWQKHLKPTTIAHLLTLEFFPMWHNILYLWLTDDGKNFDEIAAWFQWWKEQIPPEISRLPSIEAEWNKALTTINVALELGDRAKTDLPAPAAGPARPPVPASAAPSTPRRPAKPQTEATFREVVEDWCAAEDVVLWPLGEAHAVTGQPLFRITASAERKGGVVVYFKGDVLWAQGKADKSTWVPMGLDENLVSRARGR